MDGTAALAALSFHPNEDASLRLRSRPPLVLPSTGGGRFPWFPDQPISEQTGNIDSILQARVNRLRKGLRWPSSPLQIW